MKILYAVLFAALAGCTSSGQVPSGGPPPEPVTIMKGAVGVFGGCLRIKVVNVQLVDGCLNIERSRREPGSEGTPLERPTGTGAESDT